MAARCKMATSVLKTCFRSLGLRRHLIRHVVRQHSAAASSNILNLLDRGVFQGVFPIGQDKTDDLKNRLIGSPQCLYCGFDPTADSLHIGNLLAVIALLHAQRAGHHVIAVLGGATARIGDPSGKSTERNALEAETIDRNIASIESSLRRIFSNHQRHFWHHQKPMHPAKILNNADWYSDINIIQFVSSVGRIFRMGDLLSRTSVQSRLSSSEGMSFTEFTYQLFQAFDWLHLYNNYNCRIQVGGSDQTGNIVSGYDLISRTTKQTVYGLTVPLVTSTTGDKLGKTAGNAVWLNAERTSPYELYQFYLNVADSDVERFLKLFTFRSSKDIKTLLRQHNERPELRTAQKKLAEDITLLVHGEDGVASAKRCTDVFFGQSITALVELTESELKDLFRNTPTSELFLDPGMTVMDAVMAAHCFSREVDADRVIRAGGVYINHQQQKEPQAVLSPGQHVLSNNLTLIRVGKKNYYLIKWMN